MNTRIAKSPLFASVTSQTALAVLLALLATPLGRAGTIKVVNLPATGTDAATGITPNKHYVCALDFGNNGSPPGNINSVPFFHVDPGNQTVNFYTESDPNFGGAFTLTSGPPPGNVTAACKLARTSNAGQGNLAGQADGNMRGLLTDLIYVGSGAPVGSFLGQEYAGLTVGHPYSLRIYYRYWGNAVGDRTLDVVFNGEGTWQAYEANPLDQDAGGAHYLAYDFTASSTSVVCYLTNLIGNGSMMIYGATLEDASYPYAPFLTYQPKATVVGNPSVFSVTAIGTPTLAYQWYMNTVSNYDGATALSDGAGVSGSSTPNLTFANDFLNYYYVVVSNDYGAVTSTIVQLNPKPTIVAQPAPVNVANSYVAFNVTAGGIQPLAYQWYMNTASNYTGASALSDGNGYAGATTASLWATNNLQNYYFVVVANTYGSVTSTITAYAPFPTIVAQPSPFRAGNTVGFNVTGSGWPTLGYQWYMNSVSDYSGASPLSNGGGVSGATTPSVIVANLTAYYFVVLNNAYGSVTSRVVQLAGPLTLTAAGEPIWNQASQTNVVVLFSDVLDPVTATAVGNYSLDNGASVLSATLGGSNEVVLGTSVLTPGLPYTLTVQNVKQYFGIALSPSPTSVPVGVYPANLALWVRADTGVTRDASGVSQWNDLSGNANHLLQTLGAPYAPQLATNALGDPVVRFTGADLTFLQASSSASLALTGDLSILAVVSFATLEGGTNGTIVSKTGAAPNSNMPAPFDYYVSATNAGARLYRGNGSAYGQFTASAGPSLGTPHLLAVTESGNTVTHFLDGVLSGRGVLNNNFNATNCTDAGQPLSVGIRGDTVNRLSGDLSELIIAGSPLSSYDLAALNKYLAAQHHLVLVNPTPAPLQAALAGNQLTLSWPADHIGWGLQSNSVGLKAAGSWFPVSGSTMTNQITLTPDPTKPNVFYRMVYPAQ